MGANNRNIRLFLWSPLLCAALVCLSCTAPDVPSSLQPEKVRCPTGTSIDWKAAREFAAKARLAYQADSAVLSACGADSCGFFVGSSGSARGFLQRSDTSRIQWIAVRGTKTLTDIRKDADFLRTKDGNLDINLHRGFASAAQEVLPAILEGLRADYPVYLTGHSLGGAISVILALHLRQRGFTVKCITFGQPKVTDTRGAAKVEGLDVLRFIHGNDPVAMVPPAEWSPGNSIGVYAHFGREIVFNSRSSECLQEHYSKRLDPLAWWNMADLKTISDHEMTNYLSAVQAWN